MVWASIISGILKAVAIAAEYLSDKQLLDAGQSKAIAEGLQRTLNNLQKVKDVNEEITDCPHGDFVNSVRNKYTRRDDE